MRISFDRHRCGCSGRELADKFQTVLKRSRPYRKDETPFGHDVEYIDPALIRRKLRMRLFVLVLISIGNIGRIQELRDQLKQSENQITDLKEDIDNLSSEKEKTTKENKELTSSLERLEFKQKSLREDLKTIKTSMLILKINTELY